jgi:hypothetical protein
MVVLGVLIQKRDEWQAELAAESNAAPNMVRRPLEFTSISG